MHGAVSGNKVISSYFIDGHLNGKSYISFLEHILDSLLEDLPLITRQTM